MFGRCFDLTCYYLPVLGRLCGLVKEKAPVAQTERFSADNWGGKISNALADQEREWIWSDAFFASTDHLIPSLSN